MSCLQTQQMSCLRTQQFRPLQSQQKRINCEVCSKSASLQLKKEGPGPSLGQILASRVKMLVPGSKNDPQDQQCEMCAPKTMQNPGLGFENVAILFKLCPETILEQTEPTQRGRALAGGSPVAPRRSRAQTWGDPRNRATPWEPLSVSAVWGIIILHPT